MLLGDMMGNSGRKILVIAVLLTAVIVAAGFANIVGGAESSKANEYRNFGLRAQSDSWSDTFADSSKIASFTNISVSNGNAGINVSSIAEIWSDTKRTTTSYSSYYPQVVLDSANNKLHYTYTEYDDRGYNQIWTDIMNTDGTGWSAAKRTTTNYASYFPQLVIDNANNKLYYTYSESEGLYYQIWTASMNTDGTGWSAAKRTTTNYISYNPQLVLDSANNKLYYTYYESDGTHWQIWTASMNTDGTGWSAAKRTTTSYNSYDPQLVLDSANNKLHYTYLEYDEDNGYNQIWTASMNTDGTGWSAAKRTTTSYNSVLPQLVLDTANNKLYYIYYEYDGTYYQIWTASMNTDGTGWSAAKRTTTSYNSYYSQLVLDSANNKLYYTYYESDGSYAQIWTASMNTDGTGWSAAKRTTTSYNSYDPQLVLDSANNKLYYTYYESEGSYYQIWTAALELINIYHSSAELASVAVTPTSLHRWDKFYVNATTLPETGITYEIWKGDGSAKIMDVVNGQDISAITEPSIRLKAVLSTTNTTKTPAIHDWSVTWLSNSQSAVTLNSPANNVWQNSKTVDFKYTPIDDYGFTNCSLWTNETGVLALTKLNTTAIVNNTVNTIQHTFSYDGIYSWNIKCYDNAITTQSVFASSDWIVGIDTVSPINPTSCTEVSGVQNNTWQSSVSSPSFNWAGANGEPSGINGYYYYFGPNIYGTSTNYTTTASCTPPAPGEGTFYLRVLTRDNAGNNATSWKTIFVFKYDATQPTGTISINAGAEYTNTTAVTLTLTYNDEPSGIAQVRYSNDGNWDTEVWEDATNTKDWTLTVGDVIKTVYYQIKDNAGLISTTYSDTIILDTTPPAAVTGLTSVAKTKDLITLSWSESTETDFKQYEVYKATKADFSDATLVTTITNKDTTEYTVTDLLPGTTYYFKIKTIDQASLSTFSGLMSGTTETEAKEETNWLLIGGIIGLIVIVAIVAVAVVMFKKRKRETV